MSKMQPTIRVVDIGGNGLRRADVGGTNEVINFASIGPVSSIEEVIIFAGQDLPSGCEGIAYATAGALDGGVIISSPNVQVLNGVNLAETTQQAIGKPCRVFNDMEAATTGIANLLWEKNFTAITWSSGIGVRVWSGGGILSPCEAGHTLLDASENAPECKCGQKGCPEAIFGGHTIRAKVIKKCESLEIEIPSGMDPCAFLDKAYDNGHRWAIEEYSHIALWMARFLMNLQATVKMPFIIWKGSMAKNMLVRMEPEIRRVMAEFFLVPSWMDEENLRFLESPEPIKDALIGAAICFQQAQDAE